MKTEELENAEQAETVEQADTAAQTDQPKPSAKDDLFHYEQVLNHVTQVSKSTLRIFSPITRVLSGIATDFADRSHFRKTLIAMYPSGCGNRAVGMLFHSE